MMILIRQIITLKRERDAYKKQLVYILKHWKSQDLTYEDCQNVVATFVKYNEENKFISNRNSSSLISNV